METLFGDLKATRWLIILINHFFLQLLQRNAKKKALFKQMSHK